MDAYDRRLDAILHYKGTHSGRVWKDWSEVIMAFNLQNKPFSTALKKCHFPPSEDWICGRSSHIREILGPNNPIKISSGGFGGDVRNNCTFIGTTCEHLDSISGKIHGIAMLHTERN